jgi:hypothetical protein
MSLWNLYFAELLLEQQHLVKTGTSEDFFFCNNDIPNLATWLRTCRDSKIPQEMLYADEIPSWIFFKKNEFMQFYIL